MICPTCKRELPADSKFCQYCGASLSSLSSPKTSPPKKAKKKPKTGLIILVIALVLVLGLVGAYYGTYNSAKRAASEGDFTRAEKLLIVPPLTQVHDSDLLNYVIAGRTWENRDYSTAKKLFSDLTQAGYMDSATFEKSAQYYEALEQLNGGSVNGLKTIKSLARDGFPLAVEGLASAKKTIYSYAVSQYKAGNGQVVARIFNELDGYERSADYSTLISQSDYQAVKKLIGFENANDILLDRFAYEFLTGTWRSSDGLNSFTLTKAAEGGYNSQYFLPYLTMDNSVFEIDDGIYYLRDKGATLIDSIMDRVEKKNVFRFTIVDASTINVYCYKDGSTYRLYRQ